MSHPAVETSLADLLQFCKKHDLPQDVMIELTGIVGVIVSRIGTAAIADGRAKASTKKVDP